jgi:uncharacterized protein YdcH (DUF465 family)
MNREALRERLLLEDRRFRALVEKHRQYDQELEELSQRRFLSEEDQLREVELKKYKLILKDEMEQILLHQKKHSPV